MYQGQLSKVPQSSLAVVQSCGSGKYYTHITSEGPGSRSAPVLGGSKREDSYNVSLGHVGSSRASNTH